MNPADPLPARRHPFVDLLRVGGLSAVIVGHWLAAVIVADGGRVLHRNAVEVNPRLAVLTWIFQVMPLIFFAGGFANALSWRSVCTANGTTGDYLRKRFARLLRPTLIFIGVWTVVTALAQLSAPAFADRFVPATKNVATPLWFLAVYVPLIAATPGMAWLQRRFGALTLAALAVGIAGAEALRLGLGLSAAAQLNSALVWLLFHQLGLAYGTGSFGSPRHGLWLFLASSAGVLVCTLAGPFSPSLIGVDDGRVSNTSPPSGYLAAFGVAQIGLALALRPALMWSVKRLRLPRALAWLNARAMTAYLWHSTALGLVGVAWVELGWRHAPAGTLSWWSQRPGWVLACAAVLSVLVPLMGRISEPPAPVRPALRNRRPVSWWTVAFGIGFFTTGTMELVRGGFGVEGPAVRALLHLGVSLLLLYGALRSEATRVTSTVVGVAVLLVATLAGTSPAGAAFGLGGSWPLVHALVAIGFAFGGGVEAARRMRLPSALAGMH